MTTATATFAIRPADADDARDVARLEALDSTAIPAGPRLLGVVDGRALAVVSVATGVVAADPFAPTADLVALLRARAERLRAADAPVPHGVLERLRRPQRPSVA